MSDQGKLDTPKKGKLDSAIFTLFGEIFHFHMRFYVQTSA